MHRSSSCRKNNNCLRANLMDKETKQKAITAICENFSTIALNYPCPDKELPNYIVNELEKLETIMKSVARCDQDCLDKKKQYDSDIKIIQTRKKLIQDSCTHLATKYWPDASGNNDSTTQCLICGKEI